MKRGTASRVILGKNTIAEMPGGVFVGTDVILGKKDGLTNDFNGLVLSNTVMLGKKVSHAAIISVIVRGADRIVLPDAIANSLQYVKAFGGTEQLSETYLDTVTLDGGCEQNGTPTPTVPVDIVCNNGAIKYSLNMANVNAQTVLVGYYISVTGVVTASTQNWIYQDYIPVEPNTTYTLTMSSSIYFVSISEYSTADDSGFIVRDASGSGAHTQFTITTSANTHFVRFGANIDGSSSATLERVLAINWMLNKGNSMPYTPYSPTGIYTDGTQEVVTDSVGNTASAEMLLKVGDYKDTQEVISGTVTRNVGVKVFDGTEGFTELSTPHCFRFGLVPRGIEGVNPICSHYPATTITLTVANMPDQTIKGHATAVNSFYIKDSRFTTEAELQAWLAAQYAAGTPVIVVYALETPTTETVPGQSLSKSPVTQTAGSISNLPIATTESTHTAPTPTQPLQINTNNGVLKLSPNLFNKNDAQVGKNWNNSDMAYSIASGYIPAKKGDAFSLSISDMPKYASTTWAVLDSNYTYLGGTSSGSPITQDDCAYIRLSIRCANTDSWTQSDLDNAKIQLEPGSTATPYIPYGQIYTDGTVETIGIKDSNNLLPVDAQPDVLYPITVTVATSWTASANVNNGQNLAACEIRYYNESKQQINYYTLTVYSDGRMYKTFSITPAAKYVSITRKQAYATTPVTELKVETGTIMTPYYNGGTATTEMLLKVGNYQDVQSILDGVVTRNVGVKVFDGTESFNSGQASGVQCVQIPKTALGISSDTLPNDSLDLICTHYKAVNGSDWTQSKLNTIKVGSGYLFFNTQYVQDSASFEAYLAEQYAAGTPVIMVYPLATPTTESVTGQALQVTDGDNVLEITQASMDGLELEAQYNTLVQLTVQEVESANLDNDVTVTIL